MAVEPVRRMIDLDGLRLESALWPGEAPTLVLLHEGLGSVGLWRGFPARLAGATGREVFAWSRQGYGASDPVPLPRPLDYMQREAVERVGPVLDAAGIGRCVLLGHSDGASIAALYAAMASDPRVAGVILLAVHVVVEDVSLAGIKETRERWRHGDLRARLARHHADVDGAFLGWNQVWLDPRFRAWSIAGTLPGIAVPTLVVQGTADPYGTVRQSDLVAARAGGPVETLVLEGVGHHPHLEAPEPTLAAVAAFLNQITQDNAFSNLTREDRRNIVHKTLGTSLR